MIILIKNSTANGYLVQNLMYKVMSSYNLYNTQVYIYVKNSNVGNGNMAIVVGVSVMGI